MSSQGLHGAQNVLSMVASGGFLVFWARSLDAALDHLLQVNFQPEITLEWSRLVLGTWWLLGAPLLSLTVHTGASVGS